MNATVNGRPMASGDVAGGVLRESIGDQDFHPVAGVGLRIDGGEAVWAFCAFGDPAEVDELGRLIAARLRIHHTGLRFRRVDLIPSTDSGKVDYAAVQGWVP